MQEINFIAVLVAGLIPLFVGFIYYNKNVAGKAWMGVTGITEDKAKEANMVLMLVLTYVFSVMVAVVLTPIVVHQFGLQSLFFADFDNTLFHNVLQAKGHAFRTFGHGASHGLTTAVLLVFPILAVISLYEMRGWKYVFINWGYWAISLTLMGGLLCAWQ